MLLPMKTTRSQGAASILVTLLLVLGTAAQAAPLAEPGDVGLRHDIQVLADYGAIRGPVTTWPMSWDALLAELERTKAEDFVLPNKVMPTYDRVLARAQRETRRGEPAFSASLAGADMPTRIRGFSDTPRARGEVRAGFSWFSEHLTVDLNVAGVDAPVDGEDVRPDGSQVALDVRQLERCREHHGALVGSRLGWQPDPVEQCAAVPGADDQPQPDARLREQMAELDRPLGSECAFSASSKRNVLFRTRSSSACASISGRTRRSRSVFRDPHSGVATVGPAASMCSPICCSAKTTSVTRA